MEMRANETGAAFAGGEGALVATLTRFALGRPFGAAASRAAGERLAALALRCALDVVEVDGGEAFAHECAADDAAARALLAVLDAVADRRRQRRERESPDLRRCSDIDTGVL